MQRPRTNIEENPIRAICHFVQTCIDDLAKGLHAVAGVPHDVAKGIRTT